MIRITTLSENTATNAEKELGLRGSFLAEWGLSILIETDEMTVLLDTGESISATHNADILGIDLAKIDKIVLSHSHSDHTGGLREMLRRIRKKEIRSKPIKTKEAERTGISRRCKPTEYRNNFGTEYTAYTETVTSST